MTAERPSRAELLFVVAVSLALFFFILPAYMDWAAADVLRGAAPEKLAEATGRVQCPRPSEHESLVIFVNADAGGLVRMDCHLVGARGAYARRR